MRDTYCEEIIRRLYFSPVLKQIDKEDYTIVIRVHKKDPRLCNDTRVYNKQIEKWEEFFIGDVLEGSSKIN